MATIVHDGPIAAEVFRRMTRGDVWNGPSFTISSDTVDCTTALIEAKVLDEAGGPARYDLDPDVTAEESQCTFTLTIPEEDSVKLMCGTLTIPVTFRTDTFGPLTVAVIRLSVEAAAT